jgi:hypothetical protein
MESNLKEVIEDLADTDVKKAEVLVKIINIEGENRFKIKDTSMEVFLDFQPGTNHMKSRLEVGSTYRLFSIQRASADTLSYIKIQDISEDQDGLKHIFLFLFYFLLVSSSVIQFHKYRSGRFHNASLYQDLQW